MKLDVVKLGIILKEIEKKFKLDVLIKSTLSGGWVTINGGALIEKYPSGDLKGCASKKNNFIEIKVNNSQDSGTNVKIIGAKDKLFDVEISKTRYKEFRMGGLNLNKLKISEEECKIKIDDNIVFTVHEGIEEVEKIINLYA